MAALTRFPAHLAPDVYRFQEEKSMFREALPFIIVIFATSVLGPIILHYGLHIGWA